MSETKKQFMDFIMPMPIVEKLNSECWGVPEVGARDQGNGLEDRTMKKYSYWDGKILKKGDKYYMFASRWDQVGGHWGNDKGSGWLGSQAIISESDNLYGPYTDKGPIWPDWCEGAGHNVFPFEISEKDRLYADGYRYAVIVSDVGKMGKVANGTIHISRDMIEGYELIENGNDGKLLTDEKYWLSNVSITVMPDGRYMAVNRRGDIAVCDSLAGRWDVIAWCIWETIPAMKDRIQYIEDGVLWYSDGRYNIVVNDWEAREAYYLTSEDGIKWNIHEGFAYTPKVDFIRYEDGSVNRWTKMERPGIYVEDGIIKALTFAVIDVHKDKDLGDDMHGSKVIVVPFDGEKIKDIK